MPDPMSSHEVGVVDGDTFDLLVDQGFYSFQRIRVRLSGVDTHEVYGVSHDSWEYQQGVAESEFVRDWVQDAPEVEWPLILTTEGAERGSFRRWLGELYRVDRVVSLGEVLEETFPVDLDAE